MPLAVAAIGFLNPAPLMWDFEHTPRSAELATRYALRYMQPSQCAAEVLSGASDLGLIPVATLKPELAVVPGCTIASLHEVRSILLLIKHPAGLTEEQALKRVHSVAADTASRSSVAYARVLFEHFLGAKPALVEHAADPITMLSQADAALLIGDPALLAREHQAEIEQAVETPLLWLDLATLWRRFTGLPWVAAVWAVRPESLAKSQVSPQQLITDLNRSRDAGLAHTDQLVSEWTGRIAVPRQTIRTYLTRNIHYTLDDSCLRAIHRFRELAASAGVLPPLPELHMLA